MNQSEPQAPTVFDLQQLPWLRAVWKDLRSRMKLDKLPHGMLLQGPLGCGKSVLAEHLVRTLLCAQGSDGGCGNCHDCRMVKANSTKDLLRVSPEPGRHDISVRQIRDLRENLSLSRQSAGHRAIIITPAGRMNRNAANAVLKSLEEPNPGNLFILLATGRARLPSTVLSRLQLTVILPPASADGRAWLMKQCPKATKQDCERSLLAADGAPLRALEMLNCDAMSHFETTISDLKSILKGSGQALEIAERWQKMDLENVFEWVRIWLSQYIKNIAQDIDKKRFLARLLLELYDEAQRCSALAGTPVNAQSIAERWLLQAAAAATQRCR